MPDDSTTPSNPSTTTGRGAHDDRATPVNLKVKIAEQQLVIDWKDGVHTEYALAELRRVCPCATCRSERARRDESPLTVLKTDPTGLRVTAARLVGNYAIEFEWSDGHATGIFDFRLLRSLRKE
jgi:DUF971 family protein